MDYQLFYTEKSLEELAEIIGWIAEDSAETASRFGQSLLDHVDLLRRFPRMGTTIRKRHPVRKLMHSPVLVYYEIHEELHRIEILHFRHAARIAPKL